MVLSTPSVLTGWLANHIKFQKRIGFFYYNIIYFFIILETLINSVRELHACCHQTDEINNIQTNDKFNPKIPIIKLI